LIIKNHKLDVGGESIFRDEVDAKDKVLCESTLTVNGDLTGNGNINAKLDLIVDNDATVK
jgi:hypothetical protein